MSDLWLSKTDSPLKAALRSPSLAPLQDSLAGSPDEVAVKRMWENIEGKHEPQSNRLVWGGAFAAAIVACAVIFAFVWRVPAPLELAQGGQLSPEFFAQQSVRVVSLSDGSEFKLHDDAELAMLNNEGGVFLTAVRSGKVEFHVKPGGDRRWVVDAGALSVEVVGTVFTVERTDSRASVSVTRGIVRVRGNVPGGEVMLRAGDSVSVTAPNEGLATSARPDDEFGDGEFGDDAKEDAVFTLAEIPKEDDEAAAASAEDAPQAETNEPRPTRSASNLDTLMAEADAARQAGEWQKASRLLSRVVREAQSSDPRRGIAALSFARTSGDPVAIASALELGLPSMPGSLREPALARLITAYQATGQSAQLRRVAHLYLIDFPSGPRSALAKKLANQP